MENLVNMNTAQLIVEAGKVYIIGLAVEKTVRAFGGYNKADMIKGFRCIVVCGCILLIFINISGTLKEFCESLKYYANPAHWVQGIGTELRKLLP